MSPSAIRIETRTETFTGQSAPNFSSQTFFQDFCLDSQFAENIESSTELSLPPPLRLREQDE